jgi:hypothetical protein
LQTSPAQYLYLMFCRGVEGKRGEGGRVELNLLLVERRFTDLTIKYYYVMLCPCILFTVRLHGGRRERGRIQLEFRYFYAANKGAKERTDTVKERKERGKVLIRKEKRSSSGGKL